MDDALATIIGVIVDMVEPRLCRPFQLLYQDDFRVAPEDKRVFYLTTGATVENNWHGVRLLGDQLCVRADPGHLTVEYNHDLGMVASRVFYYEDPRFLDAVWKYLRRKMRDVRKSRHSRHGPRHKT